MKVGKKTRSRKDGFLFFLFTVQDVRDGSSNGQHLGVYCVVAQLAKGKRKFHFSPISFLILWAITRDHRKLVKTDNIFWCWANAALSLSVGSQVLLPLGWTPPPGLPCLLPKGNKCHTQVVHTIFGHHLQTLFFDVVISAAAAAVRLPTTGRTSVQHGHFGK